MEPPAQADIIRPAESAAKREAILAADLVIGTPVSLSTARFEGTLTELNNAAVGSHVSCSPRNLYQLKVPEPGTNCRHVDSLWAPICQCADRCRAPGPHPSSR